MCMHLKCRREPETYQNQFFFNVRNVMHTFVSIHAFKSGTPFEGSGYLLGGKATEKVVLVISHTLTSLIKI